MNMHKMVVKWVILFSLPVIFFGCGSGSVDTTSAVNNTRALQVGDSWSYDFSGQGHSSSQNYTYSGTSTIITTQELINTETVLAATSTESVTFSSGSSSTDSGVTYMQQDSNSGDIRLYGMKYPNSVVKTVTDRPLPVIWPGTWESGKTNTTNIHYSDGTTDSTSYSYTIMGQESVTTPAGTFATWKYVIVSGTVNETFWFSPQLGNYVKIAMTNGTDSNTYILRSTNVR